MMGYGWGMGLSMILMLGFWVALIVLIVWAVTRLLPTSRTSETGPWQPTETPEQILDRRFAAGEIDVDEYRRALDQLSTARAERRRAP